MPEDIIAGKYKIVREIARSNDVVYEAIDTTMGRRLAVKELVIPPNLVGQARRERIERFHREARASGKLSHPNIVTVYDYGEDNGRYFIAMEYLEGGTLRDTLQTRGALPTQEAVDIACQVLSALSHAHAHQVVHRDVKPDNMHLLNGGQVKLTDFGIARLTEESSLTGEGQVFGTPSYMSPEQIKGQSIDHRSDLFSLAIVLYEMLAGRKPFTGDSVISITYSIMENQPPPLPGLPFGVEQVLFRALNKDAGRRFSSAEEMRRELKNADSGPSLNSPGAYQTGMGGGYGGHSLPGGYGGMGSGAPAPSYGGGGYGSSPGYSGNGAGGGYSAPAAVGTFPGAPAPTYGGQPATVFSPPPVSAPPSQTNGGPFVNWNPNSANLPPGYAGPPPPFPRHAAGPVFSEGTLAFFKAMFLALVLGGIVLGGVLLFMNAYSRQQVNGATVLVNQMNNDAKKLYEAGDLKKALEKYTAAYQKGRGTQAGEDAKASMIVIYNKFGLKAYELKDFKTAEDNWFKAHDLDPNNEDINSNLQKVYDRIGDKDAAMAEWRAGRDGKAGSLNPAAPGVDPDLDQRHQEAQQIFDAGMEAFNKGDKDLARTDWQRVVELATGTPLAEQAKDMMNKINQSETSGSPYLR
jgi:serine/threonine-protein kinase